MRKYKQITTNERSIIAHMRRQGLSQAEMARSLGRHRSSISRELSRNSNKAGVYRAQNAQEHTNARRSNSRKGRQFDTIDMGLVLYYLKRKWSPEQISQSLKRWRLLSISHETIYTYIWQNKKAGGDWHTHLRQSSKKRRKRYRAYDSRGVMAGKRSLSERPKSAENRTRKGHYEIDTVLGKGSRHCVLTLVDRKTGYTIIRKLAQRTTHEVNHALKAVLKTDSQIRTLTADNGTEFHQYEKIENATGVKFYFAQPYHSWERGTNENTNGLIRQYLPTNQSMANITQAVCSTIAQELNQRPRKRHGFRTPEDLYV